MDERLDLRHTDRSLGSVVPGYGLTPSGARERAAVVRAVTNDTHIRQRPMPVVIVTAVVALVALVVWGWQLYAAISENAPLTLLFWGGLLTFLASAAVCSWAWQLYDVQKAIVMWFAIAVLGLAAVLVIAVVLVALKGDGDRDLDFDLDGLLKKIGGSSAARDPGAFVDHVIAPLVIDAAEVMAAPGGEVVDEAAVAGVGAAVSRPVASDGPACPTCGRPLTQGLLTCPRCGAALEGR